MNIYQKLPKPFFVLAPMDDVTDTVFRQIVASTAKPDLFMTEFANADGYCSKGRDNIMGRLIFSATEQPLVAQIWGMNPNNFYTFAKDLKKMGFVGIDINMGCPERGIVKRGACSALINNPELAKQMISSVRRAVGNNYPISVKTRIGFRQVDTDRWLGFLLNQNLQAITVHTRTALQMSKVPANHDELKKVVELRDKISPKTIIIANGDILSRQQGLEIAKKYGVDGVMIGRGIFRDLFVFAKELVASNQKQMLDILLDHINLHQETWGSQKDYQALKRFYKIYVNGFDGAANLRDKLMQTKNHQEARDIIVRI